VSNPVHVNSQFSPQILMMFREYPGLHGDILDSSRGTFVLYFTHEEKEHPNHERAESHASKSLVEYSSHLSSSVTQTLQNHFFNDFKNTSKFKSFT